MTEFVGSTERLRLGIIGCGGMGGAHLRSLDQLQDRLVVTATADVVLERGVMSDLRGLGLGQAWDWTELNH